ncbi:MAG: YciI family protein [Heyndrickxia sp.]
MKMFVVILMGRREGELSEELLLKHVQHLQNLHDQGSLFLCGPFKENDKAMIILFCESLEGANQLVQRDPFVKEGYYSAYEVSELMEANEGNNWLMDIPQTKNNLL